MFFGTMAALLTMVLLLPLPSVGSVALRQCNVSATPSPELVCTQEVFGGASILNGWALGNIIYGTSLVAKPGAPPLQPPFEGASLLQPAQVVFGGCFRRELLSILIELNASRTLSGPREVDAVSVHGVSRSDTAAVVHACIAECMSIGRYRSTRDVLVGLPQDTNDALNSGDPQLLCACVPKGGIDELPTLPSQTYTLAACGDVRATALFHVNLYCAARGVEGVVCGSGCQLRGVTGCCYPGTYVPPRPSDAVGTDDEDEALAEWLQWAVIGVVSFGIVQGAICWLVQFCLFRRKDQQMAKHRREWNCGAAPHHRGDVPPPRSEAESDLLASTLLSQRYGWEHTGGADDDGEEMLFLYGELKRHTADMPTTPVQVPPSSSGGLLPPLPNASMGGAESAAFALDQEDDAIFHELFGMPPSAPRNNGSLALSSGGGCDGAEVGQQLCPICLEAIAQVSTKSSYSVVSLECRHKVHRHCLRQYFSHRVRFREALRCPVFGCDQRVEF